MISAKQPQHDTQTPQTVEEPERISFDIGIWHFELIAPHEYKLTLKDATTKYWSMTGADLGYIISVPFAHRVKAIQLRHTDNSATDTASDPLNMYFGRTPGTVEYGLGGEVFGGTASIVSPGYQPIYGAEIIFLPQMPTREPCDWTLTVNAANLFRIYPIIYVRHIVEGEPDITNAGPTICIDGTWYRYPLPFIRWPMAAGQATTNAYVTLAQAYFIEGIEKLTIWLSETGGNNVMYSIDLSMDGTNWKNYKTNIDLAASTQTYETLTDLWRYLRVQVIDKVGGTHGVVISIIEGKRML